MKNNKEDIKVEIKGILTEKIIKEYNEELAKIIIEEIGIEKSKLILNYLEKELE